MLLRLILFYFKRSHNNENFQYYTELKDVFKNFDAIRLKIAPLVATFLKCYEAEDEVLQKISKLDTTDFISAARKGRQNRFRGLTTVNRGMSYHFEEFYTQASHRLQIVFDTYGNIIKLPLNEETSAIYNLVQELYKNYAKDLQYLGLTDWVDRLSAENEGVERLIKERDDRNAIKTKYKMKEARAATDQAYVAIMNRLNALIEVEGEEAYTDFIIKMNLITKRYNLAIAQREGRAKAKKTAADAPAPPATATEEGKE